MRKNFGKIKNESKAKQMRRKLSLRKKINGTAEQPRLCVVKTNKHLQVQVIDDVAQKTLFSVQTFGKNKVAEIANKETAKIVGLKVAEKLKSSNIERAVFDRNGRKYFGVIANVADSIREHGIRI
jgi:large subunit ribosomal protein L18